MKSIEFFIGLIVVGSFLIFASLLSGNNGGAYDWNGFEAITAIGRYHYLGYHSLPLWDPFRCGGIGYMANPEQFALSPFFIFPIVLGSALGLKLVGLIHFLIGYTGFYLWILNRCGRQKVALWCATVFCLNGHWIDHYAHGHFGWIALAYLPWMYLAFDRKSSWTAVLSTFGLFSIGSPNILIFQGLFLPLYILIRSRDLSDAITFIFYLSVGAFLASFSWFPVLDWQLTYGRGAFYDQSDFNSPLSLLKSLVMPINILNEKVRVWNSWEYSAQIGVVTLFVAFLGVLKSIKEKKPDKMFVLAFLALLLAMGGDYWWFPYQWIKQLPFVGGTRVPSRFLIFFIIFFLPYLNEGFELVLKKVKHKPVVITVLFLINSIIFVPHFSLLKETWGKAKDISAMDSIDIVPRTFNQVALSKPKGNQMFREDVLTPNQGFIECVSFYEKGGFIYKGPLVHPNDGRLVDWSPNQFSVELDSSIRRDKNQTITLNMGCYPEFWETNQGEISCKEKSGLLQVKNLKKDNLELKFKSQNYFPIFPLMLIGLILITFRTRFKLLKY